MYEKRVKSFDLISDIHLEYWIKKGFSIEELVKAIVIENRSKTLVIAGDISINSELCIKFLKLMKEYYSGVVFTLGNHEYCIGKDERSKFNSIEDKIEYIKRNIQSEYGIYLLHGNSLHIDGMDFFGTMMCYDGSFADKYFKGYSEESLKMLYLNRVKDLHKYPLDRKELFEKEKDKLMNGVMNSDVIITHYMPSFKNILKEDHKLELALDCFDNSIIEDIQGKTWCYGHVHVRADFFDRGCRFINASIGRANVEYPLPIHSVKVVEL